MKHLLVLSLAVFMFSCGSGGSGDSKDSAGGNAEHSELFEKLKIADNGMPFNATYGAKIDAIKKNHSEAPDDHSDNEFLSYTKVIGPDDIYDELGVDYSFDSETGEMYYMTVDVTSSKLTDGPELYKELNEYYTGKFGKGVSEKDEEWDNTQYSATIDGKKVWITVENNKKNTDYAWVIVTVEQAFE